MSEQDDRTKSALNAGLADFVASEALPWPESYTGDPVADIRRTIEEGVAEEEAADRRVRPAASVHVPPPEPRGGHRITIEPTGYFGMVSSRRRYRVECASCGVLVHEATTAPAQRAKEHMDGDAGYERPLVDP